MTAALARLIRRYPVASFYALACAICAAAFFTDFVVPLQSLTLVWLIGVFSPTIAALVISGVVGGWDEVGRVLSGYRRWRIGWRWYLAAASMALLPLTVAAVYIALGHPPRGLAPGVTIWMYLGTLFAGLFTGPLAEETGWRGFMLPRLQGRMSALNASLLLGLLWTLWHVPMYLTGGDGMMPFPIFLPVTLVLAVLFTWVFNNTRGSLVATTLMHYSFNFSGGHIAGYLGLVPPMVLYGASGGLVVLAVVVVLLAGPRRLSRRPAAELPFAAAAR
jgi:membrane protease YdiL (CAAX protease family)